MNIVDLHYQNEEDLYCDLRTFSSGKDVQALRGKQAPTVFEGDLSAAADLGDDVCNIGPGLSSLKEVIQSHADELGKYQSLKIDSTYLLSKTSEALAEDAAALAKKNLKVIVDMRPDQMHFDRVTFYPHMPNYNSGMKLYGQILEKMKILGAKDLIIRLADVGEMRKNENSIQQRDETWDAFAALAEQQNINLHLTFDRDLRFSTVANFSRPNVFVLKGSKGTPSSYMGRTPKTTP